MSIHEEVQHLWHVHFARGSRPSDALDNIRRLLQDAYREGGPHHPLRFSNPKESDRIALEVTQACYNVAKNFAAEDYFAAGEMLLLEMWQDFGLMQKNNGRRVYRAAIALSLMMQYLSLPDMGLAYRWALLAQADDILGKHEQQGGAGKQNLITRFGLSQADLQQLNRAAMDCLKEVTSNNNDWGIPSGFAEEVIRRLAENPTTSYLLAKWSTQREFPISRGYFSALREQLDKIGESSEIGKRLEHLAFYLVSLLPGCAPRFDLHGSRRSSQTDTVVHNLSESSSATSELLGRHFLIECKNKRKESVSIQHAGYFLYRMHLAHATFGIIFSRRGLAGEDNGTAAQQLIQRAFHEDHLVCVSIKDQDLDRLEKGEISLWWMLVEKIERLRFGKPSEKK